MLLFSTINQDELIILYIQFILTAIYYIYINEKKIK